MTQPEPATIKILSTSDGLHLDDSILWFDSNRSGQLSFLSSALLLHKTSVPQVITTEETAKILEAGRRKPNALICQYNRPFSIGKLRMELLPSGSVLGGASLHVETGHGRLLYAPQLQTNRIPTVRQMQLKRSNTLVLGATLPTVSSLPNRRREKERLVAQLNDCTDKNIWPIILCPAIATAQEITKLLTDHKIPVAVHSTIHKLNRIYEAYGSQLGQYSVYSPKHTKNKVILYPVPPTNNFRIPKLPEGSKILIKDSPSDHDLDGIDRLLGSYTIGSTCDVPELKEVITAVRPHELYFFGPYTKAYVDEMSGFAPVVKALYTDDQPTLF